MEAAAKIDEILAKSWSEAGVKPRVALRDEQFLRRVYLELGGRVPTFSEAVAFLTSKSKDKRAELIDSLLESPTT